MNVKKLAPVVLASALLLASCSGGGAVASSTPASSSETLSSEVSSSAVVESSSEVEITEEVINTIEEQLATMTENQYPELAVTAEIRNRDTILPGGAIELAINIVNNGSQTILYPVGAQTNEIPDALIVDVPGLQTVVPEGNLGIRTMDMQYKELAPGETLNFVYTVLADEPNAQFDAYTFDVYMSDNGKYIATLPIEELQAIYPDIIPAQPGTYTGKVYFQYMMQLEEGTDTFAQNPTGYNTAEVTIGVVDTTSTAGTNSTTDVSESAAQ